MPNNPVATVLFLLLVVIEMVVIIEGLESYGLCGSVPRGKLWADQQGWGLKGLPFKKGCPSGNSDTGNREIMVEIIQEKDEGRGEEQREKAVGCWINRKEKEKE